MVNRRIRSLALAASLGLGLGLGLAACGSAAHPGGAAGMPRLTGAAGRASHTHGGCPVGRPLPPNVGEAVDYVDFFQLGGRTYDGFGTLPVRASQLGPVIGHIRCSLTANEDPRLGPPPVIDGTAAFLPAGAPVYGLRGYPPACRLAAYLDGRLQVYLAQADTKDKHGHVRPAPCALRPASATPAGA
jgi:hypothetical protein